jgi:hypothetical protein
LKKGQRLSASGDILACGDTHNQPDEILIMKHHAAKYYIVKKRVNLGVNVQWVILLHI